VLKLNQIASEGGLLPFRSCADKFEVFPAKRREFIVDFSKTLDGSSRRTTARFIYMVNTYQI
jgi:hypothetical protein